MRGQQALLGAVVQVALEPTPVRVTGGDDAGCSRHSSAESLRPQTLVVHGQEGGRSERRPGSVRSGSMDRA